MTVSDVLRAEPIDGKANPPTAADADSLGYVQYLDDRGFWSIRFWYNVALHGQPWLHTLAWQKRGSGRGRGNSD